MYADGLQLDEAPAPAHDEQPENSSMLISIPRSLPRLTNMVDDLAASPKQIARALRVNERTVRRWIAQDWAPQPAALALFWCTRWGRSTIDAETENTARLYYGLANSLWRERACGALAGIHRPAANDEPLQPPRLADASRALP